MIRVALASIGFAALAACAAEGATELRTSTLSGPVLLVSPTAGGRFDQNDANIGCTAHPARGYGFRLAFDWQDVEGAEKYDIVFQQKNATFAAIRVTVSESQYQRTWCNAFVIDANLNDWGWQVAAIGPVTDGRADTLWSERRVYGFKPCRLADTTPCNAPPP